MVTFENAIEYVLEREGSEFVNNPRDPGNATKFGITLRTLKQWSPSANTEDVKALTQDGAKIIYRKLYWPNAPYEKLVSQDIANYLFDCAVNMGLAAGVKIAQRALMAVNGKYNYVKDDAVLGQATLSALNDVNNIANSKLLIAMRSERAGYYREILAKNPLEIVFAKGWMQRAYS